MKKIILITLSIILLFSFTLIQAEDNNEYFIDELELKRGTVFINDLYQVNDESIQISNQVSNVKTEDNKEVFEYLLLGSRHIINSSFNGDVPYVAYYINGNLKFELALESLKIGTSIKALLLEDEIIILSNSLVDKFYSYSITRLNYQGEVIRTYTRKLDNHTIAFGIEKIDNTFYVIGESYATDILNDNKLMNGKMIFISTYSIDLMPLQSNVYGNYNGLNDLIDYKITSDAIIVLANFNGTGIYNSSYGLLSIGKNLRANEVIYFEKANYSLVNWFNNVALIKENSYNESIITIYNKNLTSVHEFKMPLLSNKDYKVILITKEVIINNTNYLILLISGSINGYFCLYDIYDNLVSYYIFQNKGITKDLLYYDDSYILFNNINLKISTIKKMRMIKLVNQKLYVNNRVYEFEKFDDRYPFGTYSIDVKYDLGDASIITKTIIDVPFLSSVEENTIYDINHEVTFNGEGTLNGIAINSGYVITEAGNYTLVVKGKSTDLKVVNFTIEKLCIDIDKEPNELKDMNVNKETISINQLDKRKLINYGNLSYQEVVNNDSDKYFIYLVTFAIGALLGLSFSIFNLFKLRKKTNK